MKSPREILQRVRNQVRRFGWKKKTFSPEETKGLLFAQQHVFTKDFFKERLGQFHTVALPDFPHYRFLKDGDRDYINYLQLSWEYYFPDLNTTEARLTKVQQFTDLREHIRVNGIKNPIIVAERPDGRHLILEGNHRAAVAHDLGIPLPALAFPRRDYLDFTIQAPKDFYGTQRLGKPYQSVYLNGREILPGRRRDIAKRMSRVAAEDLKGRTVLDLGCNVGMSCYLAAEAGATRVVGVDANPNILTVAIRLSAFFAQPQVDFALTDLSTSPVGLGHFDTVLCFSVLNHLSSHEFLRASLNEIAPRVVYLEGEAGGQQSDYAHLLEPETFSRIDCVGYGDDGTYTRSKTRPLFRCEVREGVPEKRAHR